MVKACFVAAVTAAIMFMGTASADTEVTKIQIENATYFMDTVSKLVYGQSYSLFLLNDLDFNEVKNFDLPDISTALTLDGQGHTIKNLNVASTRDGAGFISRANGIIIKNLIIDSSCSISSTSAQRIGSFVGYCYSRVSACVVENSINMAAVSYNGNNVDRIGGIVGNFDLGEYGCVVRGCVNYGQISVSVSSGDVYIGGIAGYCYSGKADNKCTIHSSINYGSIAASCTESAGTIRIGGIIGMPNSHSLVENCVNFGGFTNENCGETEIGGIAGHTDNGIIDGCYVDDSLNYSIANTNGNVLVNNSYTFDENFTISMSNGTNVSLSDLLSSYVPDNDPVESEGGAAGYLSNTLMNPRRSTVTFYVNNKTYLTSNSSFIMMPTLSGGVFDGWYSDEYYTRNFTATTITTDTNIYGIWTTEYTHFNKSAVVLPEKPSLNSSSSSSSSSMMSSSSSSVKLSSSSSSILSSSSIKSSSSSSPSSSTKLSSSSSSSPVTTTTTKFVEIVFDSKQLTTDDIKDMVEDTMGCVDCFEIKVIETKDGFTSIIIRFNDVEQAKSFVETISLGSASNGIKINYSWIDDNAFSGVSSVVPNVVLSLFLFF